ncbi:hypothetical protein QTO34_017057 [Cnephaeus nilssonii]|uniref:Uncharacterized protein n=1 Tax=Cnephaeus nilssonii TaxID=3371016 RepID=A0AA40LQX4_CNENI|nr:hypothetical protein QTO34_017057 [Eptesicus nilssonii]
MSGGVMGDPDCDLAQQLENRQTRKRRESPGGFFDPHIYTQMPLAFQEFKARNQIAAGFESVLCWWPTVNKNKRLINYTRDAVKGIAEQLDASSRMTWENSLALDMILAEKEEYAKIQRPRLLAWCKSGPPAINCKELEGFFSLVHKQTPCNDCKSNGTLHHLMEELAIRKGCGSLVRGQVYNNDVPDEIAYQTRSCHHCSQALMAPALLPCADGADPAHTC